MRKNKPDGGHFMRKLIFVLISFLIGIQGAKANIDPKKAEAFMNNIGSTVINVLTDKSISDQERADKFETILETSFNVKAVGKFVLGRYWNQATEAEKEQFLSLFKSTTVASYAT